MTSSKHLNVFTIAPGTPFLSCLADSLANGALLGAPLDAADPLALARITVLLPTRRAARALRDELISRNGGGPLLLPRIRALGDVDEAELALDPDAAADFPGELPGAEPLAPALSALERQLVLTQLVLRWGQASAASVLHLAPGEAPVIPGSPAHAARLAADLARLMDAVESEGLDFSGVRHIVPDDHAGYWQITLEFLRIVMELWPALLAERGALSPTARRNALIDGQAMQLLRAAPADPIIAAGSTGSLPATARLLKAIASLPNGAIILPGLDLQMDGDEWRYVGEDHAAPSHPQHGLARLLKSLGVSRDEVRELGIEIAACSQARTALVREALRPAALTGIWRDSLKHWTGPMRDAVREGFSYVEAASVHEEALIIALMMRETVEHPARTMALITPDRQLARRVCTELARWNIALDDSAGTPLAQTPHGLFARLTADLLVEGLAPVALLAVLKHPLCQLGLPAGQARRGARALERLALRGPRPTPTIAGLRTALAACEQAAEDDLARARIVVDRLEHCMQPLDATLTQDGITFAQLVALHGAIMSALMAVGDQGAGKQTVSEDGEMLSALLQALAGAQDAAFSLPLADYPGLLSAYLAGRPVRARRAAHPRLFVWGLLEARLMHADTLILGGLNEGVWPAQSATDPWLNRAMRETLGLAPPERRIGLSAHDFAQAFAKPNIVLTRAVRTQGAQTVPSRWLLRIDAVLKGLGDEAGLQQNATIWPARARALLDPLRWNPVPAPAPRPPVEARPRRLSVTRIETWIRDPYALYARHVLKLKPLDPLDAAPDAASRGTVIHDALAQFMHRAPDLSDPQQARDRLIELGRQAFARLPDAPEVKAFWWRRFLRAAGWFVNFEAARHADRRLSCSEIAGQLGWGAGQAGFTLEARADRIDLLTAGGLAIYDYKTGMAPSSKEVAAGFAPQLPLEAAIALAGGFAYEDLNAGDVARLGYIIVSGGRPPGSYIEVTAAPAADLAHDALSGLKELVEKFDNPAQAYYSRTRPKFESRFDGDYDHLARAREWMRQPANGGATP